jgi:hypothetical protein
LDIERIIGSREVHIATVVSALLVATAIVLRAYAIAPWTESTLFLILSVVVGVIAFIGLIHSFRALYYRWLAFAGFLQRVVVTLLFGGCYLLVVPWFALVLRVIDLRRSRGRLEPRSVWVPRPHTKYDERYFTRMG